MRRFLIVVTLLFAVVINYSGFTAVRYLLQERKCMIELIQIHQSDFVLRTEKLNKDSIEALTWSIKQGHKDRVEECTKMWKLKNTITPKLLQDYLR